jgi:hypothetical protein
VYKIGLSSDRQNMSLRSLLAGLRAPHLFEPHMPNVSEPLDLRDIAARARAILACAERKVAILTPDRNLRIVPAPPAGSMSQEHVDPVRRIFPGTELNITVVSFTALQALEKNDAQCIPMLGILAGLAYVGHKVLVFEGHPSAFETVVAGSDALVIDSGMLPFLQSDWFDVARRNMPQGKILCFDRRRNQAHPLVRSKNPPGWKETESDGEGSYLNCLLATLAKLPPTPVEVIAGQPVPDLRLLASDPKEREWVAELPFQYEALDSAEVIRLLQRVSKWETPAVSTSRTFHARLATGHGLQDVYFDLRLREPVAGSVGIKILRKSG